MSLLSRYLPLFLLVSACPAARGAPRAPGKASASNEPLVEKAFESGLTSGWQDYGWAPRDLGPGHPAQLDFSHNGGWILYKPKIEGRFGALVFRFKAPDSFGDFLEVRVDSTRQDLFPRILIGPAERTDLPGGWSEVRLPMSKLNPDDLPFQFIVLRAAGSVGGERVSVDHIGFTADHSNGGGAATGAGPAEDQGPVATAAMRIDVLAKGKPISPMIYGIAFDQRLDAQDQFLWQLSPAARRWGGNTASTYNWKIGNAWNTGNDWFFENLNLTGNPQFTYEKFLDANLAAGVETALTVPTMGWVAKDTQSGSFPISIYGPERNRDPYRQDFGDGFTPDGKPLDPGPPTRVAVEAPPELVAEWVSKIRDRDQKRKVHSVQMYMLDNEPMLWNSTHRDVHPDPTSYDELLDRLVRYGTAVRKADPDAVIAGPALWGWPAYFYSAVDAVTHFRLNPDRLAHGNMPLLPWLLQKIHLAEAKSGGRLLNVVDVHYYPMADRVAGRNGGTDAKTAALRIRSTRSLWDPNYVDESWIQDTIQLIPRLQDWIDKYDPGLSICIGEYNFGAEEHMSGGLAEAEALGHFGQLGVKAAFFWTYPPKSSPAFWAFRAFRNFDGHGGRFQDLSLPTSAPEESALFASRSPQGDRLVAVALNEHPDERLDAAIDLGPDARVRDPKVYTYSRATDGFVEVHTTRRDGNTLHVVLPAYSITVLDVPLGRP